MKPQFDFKRIFFFLLALLLLNGCSGKSKDIKTVQGDPAVLYQQALALYNKRQYADAVMKFDSIRSSFPDSPPYTFLAELKVADCFFHTGSFVEAAAAYEEFRKIHPTYEDITYVQYQIGNCYYSLMLSADRDPTYTQKALTAFEYLVANYPPSMFTEKGKEKVQICRQRLADHQFVIAEYYYNKRKYVGAASRFEALLERYPKVKGEDRTLLLLGKSYVELEQLENARLVFAKLVNEYPKSPSAKEAQAMLDRGIQKKEASIAKAQARELKKRPVRTADAGEESLTLIRFEEEGKKPVSWKEGMEIQPKKTVDQRVSLRQPQEEEKTLSPKDQEEATEKEESPATPETDKQETKPEESKITASPGESEQEQERSASETEPKVETKPEEKKDEPSLLSPSGASEEKATPAIPLFFEGERKSPPQIQAEAGEKPEEKAEVKPESQAPLLSPSAAAEEKEKAERKEVHQENGQTKTGEASQAVSMPSEEERKSPPQIQAEAEVKPEEKAEVKPESQAPLLSPSTAPEEKEKASPQVEAKIEVKPEPKAGDVSAEKEKTKKENRLEGDPSKILDTTQPVDITSDRVESYTKDHLIVFKGNVVARQKDIVIYADSVEALIDEAGKSIEKVIAGGNVRVQQGLRVANCQKAIFYNLDKKIVLTGAPIVREGENTVSGEEIVFDIETNRVEVKGGSGGRGKAKLNP